MEQEQESLEGLACPLKTHMHVTHMHVTYMYVTYMYVTNMHVTHVHVFQDRSMCVMQQIQDTAYPQGSPSCTRQHITPHVTPHVTPHAHTACIQGRSMGVWECGSVMQYPHRMS